MKSIVLTSVLAFLLSGIIFAQTKNADIKKERKKNEKPAFSKKIGDLQLQSNNLNFGRVYNTQNKIDTMEVMNPTDAPLKISFKEVPAHIKIKAVPESIKPKEKGLLIATYDAAKRNEWGQTIDRVDIVINDKSEPNYKIAISATIEEDFSKLTKEQLESAPSIKFEDVNFDFGTIKQGETVNHEFKFKNEGKTNLIIRKTKANSNSMTITPPTAPIKAGESGTIKITFNPTTKEKDGQKNIIVSLVTNDPKQQSTRLNIKGILTKVEEKK